MSFTQFLVFLHVFGFAIWFGAGIAVGFLNVKVSKSKNLEQIADSAKTLDWLSKRIFIPSSLLTVVAGVLLVILAKWVAFTDFWIIFSLAGVAITFFLGGIVMPKFTKQIVKAKLENKDREVLNIHQKLIFASHVDSIIILLVLFDMMFKPKLNELGFLIISGVFLIITISLSYLRFRKNIIK